MWTIKINLCLFIIEHLKNAEENSLKSTKFRQWAHTLSGIKIAETNNEWLNSSRLNGELHLRHCMLNSFHSVDVIVTISVNVSCICSFCVAFALISRANDRCIWWPSSSTPCRFVTFMEIYLSASARSLTHGLPYHRYVYCHGSYIMWFSDRRWPLFPLSPSIRSPFSIAPPSWK